MKNSNVMLGSFSTRYRYVVEHHHLHHVSTALDCVVTLEKSEIRGDVFLCCYPKWRERSKDVCARGSVPGNTPMLPLPCQWASCAVTPSTSHLEQPFIVVVSSFVSVYTFANGSFQHIFDLLEEIQVSPRFDQRPTVTTTGTMVAFSSRSKVTVIDIALVARGKAHDDRNTRTERRRVRKKRGEEVVVGKEVRKEMGKEMGKEKETEEEKVVVGHRNRAARDQDEQVRLNLNTASFSLGPTGCRRLLSSDYNNLASHTESTVIRHLLFYSCSSYQGMIVATPRHGYFYLIESEEESEESMMIRFMCTIAFTSEILQLDVSPSPDLPMMYALTVGGVEMWSLPLPGSCQASCVGDDERGRRHAVRRVVPPVLYTVQPLHGVSSTLRRVPRGLVTLRNGTMWILPSSPGTQREFSKRRGSFMTPNGNIHGGTGASSNNEHLLSNVTPMDSAAAKKQRNQCKHCSKPLVGVVRGVGRKLGQIPKGYCNLSCFEEMGGDVEKFEKTGIISIFGNREMEFGGDGSGRRSGSSGSGSGGGRLQNIQANIQAGRYHQQRSIVKCLSHMNGANSRNEEDVDASIGGSTGPLLISFSNNPHNMNIEDAELELRAAKRRSRSGIDEKHETTEEAEAAPSRPPLWSCLVSSASGSKGEVEKVEEVEEAKKKKENDDDPYNTLVVLHLDSGKGVVESLRQPSSVTSVTAVTKQRMNFLESMLGCTSSLSYVATTAEEEKEEVVVDTLASEFMRSSASAQLGMHLLLQSIESNEEVQQGGGKERQHAEYFGEGEEEGKEEEEEERRSNIHRACSMLASSFHLTSIDLYQCLLGLYEKSDDDDDDEGSALSARRCMCHAAVVYAHQIVRLGSIEQKLELRGVLSKAGALMRESLSSCDDENMLCSLLMIQLPMKCDDFEETLPVFATDSTVARLLEEKGSTTTSSRGALLQWHAKNYVGVVDGSGSMTASEEDKNERTAADALSTLRDDLRKKINTCGMGLMLVWSKDHWVPTPVHDGVATVVESVECARHALDQATRRSRKNKRREEERIERIERNETQRRMHDLILWMVSKWLSPTIASMVLERVTEESSTFLIAELKSVDMTSIHHILSLLENHFVPYLVVVFSSSSVNDDDISDDISDNSDNLVVWLDLMLAMHVVCLVRKTTTGQAPLKQQHQLFSRAAAFALCPKWMHSWLSRNQHSTVLPFVTFLFEFSQILSQTQYLLVSEWSKQLLLLDKKEAEGKKEGGGDKEKEKEVNTTLVLVRILALILGKQLKDATQVVVQFSNVNMMKLFGMENGTSFNSLYCMLEAAVNESCGEDGRDQMIAALCDVCLRSAFHGESRSNGSNRSDESVLSIIPSDANTLYLCDSMERLHREKMSEMCMDRLVLELED